MLARTVRWLDERTHQAPFLRKALRYVFPEHWSFLLGEIALYSFLVLVGTGVYLTLFYEPSLGPTVYEGSYEPLVGREVTRAYESVVDLSFEVDAGLLMRQTHHWAANVFIAAIALHLMRVFFTGAFRKPRDLTYYVGLAMLMLAMLEGFLGYSLIDDLLSGMGLAIAYSVLISTPVVGGNLALLVWGSEYPGTGEFLSRMYIGHVFVLPILIAVLISVHLLLVTLNHHGQLRGRRKRADNVVGAPLWPSYALRSIGLMFAVTGVLFLMGGLIQINPIWLWGPYETWNATNGAQPDWYMGWLIGALRAMVSFEPTVGDYTLVPNPFFGGALLPMAVFAFLFTWPSIERRITGDTRQHHLLDRPRDNPMRTGVGVALGTFVALVLFAGSADRVFVQTGIPYQTQMWVYRVLLFVLPVLAFFVARRIALELRETGERPLLEEAGSPPEQQSG